MKKLSILIVLLTALGFAGSAGAVTVFYPDAGQANVLPTSGNGQNSSDPSAGFTLASAADLTPFFSFGNAPQNVDYGPDSYAWVSAQMSILPGEADSTDFFYFRVDSSDISEGQGLSGYFDIDTEGNDNTAFTPDFELVFYQYYDDGAGNAFFVNDTVANFGGLTPKGLNGNPGNSSTLDIPAADDSGTAVDYDPHVFFSSLFSPGIYGVEVKMQSTGLDNDFDFENWGSYELQVQLNIAAIPEPATLLLLGTGLMGLAALRRRKGE